MLSPERFVRLCAEHIGRGEPFLAYRHPNGFGLLRTGVVQVEEWDVYLGTPGDLDKHHAATAEDLDKHHAATAEDLDRIMYNARRRGDRVDHIATVHKEKQVKKGTITKARKVIAQMRKDRRCYPLQVVEFDGNGLTLEGGGLDELLTVPIGGGAGNA